MTLFLLIIAGGCGALLRYEVELAVRRRTRGYFPYGTLLINVSGSFILGLLVGLAGQHGIPPSVATVLGTGLLGAYTTFSTFSFDTISLAEHGKTWTAVANLGAGVALGLAAAALGLVASHLI